MGILQSIVLGIVQGVTEFLPISSSGFLVFIPEFFGWKLQSLAFDAIIHLATLAAVVMALWPQVKKIIEGVFKKNEWGRLGWMIVLATIPVMIFGYFGQDLVETVFRSTRIVAASFVFWGVVLYVADRYVKKGEQKLQKVGWSRSFVIGLSQVLALIPGTSRSGITITAGLFGGLSRKTAASFSFLLGIPTIAAAGGLNFIKVAQQPQVEAILPLIVGATAAFVSALLTIRFFLKFLEKNTYKEVAVFRIVLGLFLFLL